MNKSLKNDFDPVSHSIETFFQLIFRIFFLMASHLIEFLRKKNIPFFSLFLNSNPIKSIFKLSNDPKRITVESIKAAKDLSSDLETMIQSSQDTPIGVSLLDNSLSYITQNELNHHVAIAGATGEGKSTLMTTMIRHSILQGRPVIIIDPKGDKEDVNKILKLAKLAGRERDFKLFSLAFPNESCSYNPLKIGTPEQLKSKIKDALELEHEYYSSIATQFLANLFDILKYLGLLSELNLPTLYKYIVSPNELGKIENQLRNMSRTPELSAFLLKMNAVKSIDARDLQGLAAHINSMCLSEFQSILVKKETNSNEIDLIEALNSHQILYFQLNTLAYSDFGSRIGKLILQDLKLVTSQIHSNQIEKKFKFAVCFIDEFGSFATKSFSELLRTIRSAGIGMNLFFQGIADLKAVSTDFAEQILGNTKIKIILRQEIHTDVETWSAMAGTVDSDIQSHQTESSGLASTKTGLGNVHEGKKVKIEFDVFKNLSVGEAIVINKGRHIHDLIKIWQQNISKIEHSIPLPVAKSSLFSHKSHSIINNSIKIQKPK